MFKKANTYLVTYKDKKYALDFEGFKRVCFERPPQDVIESEITEAYSTDEEDMNMAMTSKVNREVKGSNNDMILYDVVKLFVVRLLEDVTIVGKNQELTFSTSLVINTLLDWGILKEL